MTLLVAGDIGGTKTILRLIDAAADGLSFQTLDEASYPSQQYSGLVPIVREFGARSPDHSPDRACLAVPGPVVDQTSQPSNLDWFLDAQALASALGMAQVRLINDFAAVCHGIRTLEAADCETLQPGCERAHAPIGVIGAGTGLGEGFLIPQGSGYQAFGTEGGHVDFAPRSAWEVALMHDLQRRLGIARVSAERVVSGPGIVAIYQFLRDRGEAAESPPVAEAVRQWERYRAGALSEPPPDPAAAIGQAAQAGQDALSAQAMARFFEAYGAEAGNWALKLLPFGGLYIAGGIAAKNRSLLRQSRFLEAFKDKGRLSPLLEQVPVRVITNQQVGLLGSVLYGTAG